MADKITKAMNGIIISRQYFSNITINPEGTYVAIFDKPAGATEIYGIAITGYAGGSYGYFGTEIASDRSVNIKCYNGITNGNLRIIAFWV